jgi:hypothetical protein
MLKPIINVTDVSLDPNRPEFAPTAPLPSASKLRRE